MFVAEASWNKSVAGIEDGKRLSTGGDAKADTELKPWE